MVSERITLGYVGTKARFIGRAVGGSLGSLKNLIDGKPRVRKDMKQDSSTDPGSRE